MRGQILRARAARAELVQAVPEEGCDQECTQRKEQDQVEETAEQCQPMEMGNESEGDDGGATTDPWVTT